MNRVCCIFNIPSLYREAIYQEIDKSFDCEWYFEEQNTDISLFDTAKLKACHFLKSESVVGRFYRVKGLFSSIRKRKDFDSYLMIGAPMCISIWILCLYLKLFQPKKKIYFWTHGWYGKETAFERVVKKTFLRLADDLFLYGNYAKDQLERQGFSSEKLHVIHNSLSYDVQLKLRHEMIETDVYRNHFGNEYPVLIFIGRLTPVKKLDMILDALDLLNKKGSHYNLVFVGDGSEKETLVDKANVLGLSDQVWFHGACYDEARNSELIYNADLCIAPGNIGLTAIHALMFGCPAVTHDDFPYQMPEFEAIIPGKTGDFFERNNAFSLVDVIDRWFQMNNTHRNIVRECCYKEVDLQWTPSYQINIIRTVLNNA